MNDDLDLGGVQRVMLLLVYGLKASGMTLGVAARMGGDLWSEVPADVSRYALPGGAGPLGWARRAVVVRRIVRDAPFDVVHAHQRGLALLSRIALIGTGVVVVEHVHNTFAPTPLARLLSFRGHRLIACGSEIGRMLVEQFGRPAGRISIVKNAVPDRAPEARPAVPTPLEPLRIVGIGRLVPEKDPEKFVDVVAALRTAGLACTAVWLGEGPLREHVERHVAAGSARHVEFPGASADVASHLGGAHLLLATSRREGLPLTILEAMSLGRAVVAPDVGSCRDVVIDGRTGILYDPALPVEALARRIVEAVREGELPRLAAGAREFFEQECSVDAMVHRIERQYEVAIAGRAIRP